MSNIYIDNGYLSIVYSILVLRMGAYLILWEFFMKKIIFSMLFVFSCVLFFTGCGDDSVEKTDPAFLAGTWANASSGASFSITKTGDVYSFDCHIFIQPDVPAKALGELDYTSPGLGPNDYILLNLTAAGAGDPDSSYDDGNALLGPALAGYQNLLATLTPKKNKTEFVFSSTDFGASMFFGGTYVKQTE